jgi:TATA-box binding protein (TBP) (component of TFIID and TFIIIB)
MLSNTIRNNLEGIKKGSYNFDSDFDVHMENSFMGLQQNPYITSLLNQKTHPSYDANNADMENAKSAPFLSMSETSVESGEVLDETMVPPPPSKLRVSTMTAVCNIDVSVDLEKLYENIDFNEHSDTYPIIRNCQFASRDIRGYITSAKQKRLKDKKTTKKKNCFQNQATMVIALSPTRQINLKIFRNGKVQMTGLKASNEGRIACQGLITKLEEMHKNYPDITVFNRPETIISDFSIVLINSDFSAGFRVKREHLYDLLFQKGIFVSYEPDIYPGVNAKYYWNTCNPEKDGICKCTKTCTGKGTGTGDGMCKKITIATFQSGNVIITGARNTQQTEDAYEFINKLFSDYYSTILRASNIEEGATDTTGNKTNLPHTKIAICKVVNYQLREKLLQHKF